MDKENDIEIPDEVDLSGLDDSTDWKQQASELQKKHREAGIRNRERTKTLRDRISELEEAITSSEKESAKETQKKSDDTVMKRLENMALKMSNITADDEVELFNKWKKDTAREADDILGNKIFQAELADLRVIKQNAAAADVKGGDSGNTAEKDADYWLSKTTKNSEGKMMFPEDLPKDFNLRAAIVDKMISSTKSDKQFYNQ